MFIYFIFINYNTITNYIVIINESVVSQTRVSGGNRNHDPHANSLALCFVLDLIVPQQINYIAISVYAQWYTI